MRPFLKRYISLNYILTQFTTLHWHQCLGSSGTIKTVKELLLAAGGDGQITLAGLEHLKQQMIQQKYIAELDLPGLTDDKRPVIAARCVYSDRIISGTWNRTHGVF